MPKRLLLQPPDIVDVEDPIIFLGGPIQDAPVWQYEAADRIHDLDDSIIVASPRKEYLPGTFVYDKQVEWETALLRKTGELGVVGFWLPEQLRETMSLPRRIRVISSIMISGKMPLQRAYGPTTRFELSEWRKEHQYAGARITLGLEEGFGNARYIRKRFREECPEVKITDNLPEMCENAVMLARNQE